MWIGLAKASGLAIYCPSPDRELWPESPGWRRASLDRALQNSRRNYLAGAASRRSTLRKSHHHYCTGLLSKSTQLNARIGNPAV